jgi:hypothetical protein
MYEVEGLKAVCVKQMITELTEENASNFLEYANLYDCDDLKRAAFKCIKK